VPTTRLSRTLPASSERVWELVRDPHHLPRWWPRVTRVEDVREDSFTEVLRTAKGHSVRADFRLAQADDQAQRLCWEQELEGTPFARVLKSALTEVTVAPDSPAGSEVTIELRQSLSGIFPRLGAHIVRRAARGTLREALDGLERIVG
jgi:uncharacterized protein YndB with AHSA1/START domain